MDRVPRYPKSGEGGFIHITLPRTKEFALTGIGFRLHNFRDELMGLKKGGAEKEVRLCIHTNSLTRTLMQ